MTLSPIHEASRIFLHSVPRFPLIPTVWRDMTISPGPEGRSHGVSDRSIFPLPVDTQIAAKNQFVHVGSYPSIIGIALGV